MIILPKKKSGAACYRLAVPASAMSSRPSSPKREKATRARPDSRVAAVPPKKQPMLPEPCAVVMSDRRPATLLLYARMMPAGYMRGLLISHVAGQMRGL